MIKPYLNLLLGKINRSSSWNPARQKDSRLLTYFSMAFFPSNCISNLISKPEHCDSNKGCLNSLPFTASQALFFSFKRHSFVREISLQLPSAQHHCTQAVSLIDSFIVSHLINVSHSLYTRCMWLLETYYPSIQKGMRESKRSIKIALKQGQSCSFVCCRLCLCGTCNK